MSIHIKLENSKLNSRVEKKVEKVKRQNYLAMDTSEVMTFLFIEIDCFGIMLSNYCPKQHFVT